MANYNPPAMGAAEPMTKTATQEAEAYLEEMGDDNICVRRNAILHFAKYLSSKYQLIERGEKCVGECTTHACTCQSPHPEQPKEKARCGKTVRRNEYLVGQCEKEFSHYGDCGFLSKPAPEQPKEIEWVLEKAEGIGLENAIHRNLIKLGKLIESALNKRQ